MLLDIIERNQVIKSFILVTIWEMNKKKTFWVVSLKVFLQWILSKVLLYNIKHDGLVGLDMVQRNKTIAVNSFGLVDPKFDQFFSIYKLSWLRKENSLENRAQMSDGKFVMEIDGSFSKRSLDLIMKNNSSFNQRNYHFLNRKFEPLKVTLKEGFIDSNL